MSKIEELHETYCLAVKSYMNSNGGALIWDAERAGIAAVVRALRDEIRKPHYSSWEDIDDFLDQILGSDAGEKVGEMEGSHYTFCSHPDEHLVVSPTGLGLSPAPAPAVCVWTPLGDRHGLFMRQCSKYPAEPAAGPYCSNCGKPITEAQREQDS